MEQNEQSNNEQNNNEQNNNERTFTQDEVNRIVADRLAKERSKSNPDLEKRVAELDKRERRLNAIEELRKNGLSDSLIDALNMNSEEEFKKSIEIIKKLNIKNNQMPNIMGHGNPIGVVKKDGTREDPIKTAMGL